MLNIVGDTEDGKHCIFGNSIYLSILYYLCYEIDVSTDISEDQVSEEENMDLNEEEDIRIDEIRDRYWMDVADEGEDKKKIHALMWEIYVKEEEIFIKI